MTIGFLALLTKLRALASLANLKIPYAQILPFSYPFNFNFHSKKPILTFLFFHSLQLSLNCYFMSTSDSFITSYCKGLTPQLNRPFAPYILFAHILLVGDDHNVS